MPIHDLLLPEFDNEIRKTRATLDRMPEGQPEYKPHEKSMALAKLVGHTAQMPQFCSAILMMPGLDLASGGFKPYTFTTREDLLATFDGGATEARAQLAATTDEALDVEWKLAAGAHTIFSGTRYHALRTFFFNHLIHHRAQLGVYLRLNNIAVPSIYGPSADES